MQQRVNRGRKHTRNMGYNRQLNRNRMIFPAKISKIIHIIISIIISIRCNLFLSAALSYLAFSPALPDKSHSLSQSQIIILVCCISLLTLCRIDSSLMSTEGRFKILFAHISPLKTLLHSFQSIIISEFGGDDPMFHCSIVPSTVLLVTSKIILG